MHGNEETYHPLKHHWKDDPILGGIVDLILLYVRDSGNLFLVYNIIMAAKVLMGCPPSPLKFSFLFAAFCLVLYFFSFSGVAGGDNKKQFILRNWRCKITKVW